MSAQFILQVSDNFTPQHSRTELTAEIAKRFRLRQRVLWSFSSDFVRGDGCFRRFRAGNVCGKLCRGCFRPDLSAARRVFGGFRPENCAARSVLGDSGSEKSAAEFADDESRRKSQRQTLFGPDTTRELLRFCLPSMIRHHFPLAKGGSVRICWPKALLNIIISHHSFRHDVSFAH